MFDRDHDRYLSAMSSVALAVMMVVVMLWIRSRMPEDTAGVVEPTVQTADNSVAQVAAMDTAMGSDGAGVLQPR